MDLDPGGQQRPSLRASDADRERFVETLRQHHVEGRLTADELAERTERAYAARTLGDLDALGTDLPPLTPPAPPPGPRRAAAKANLLRFLLWYGLLSVVLIVVWAASGRGYFWPVWPILGFMLGLGGQAIAAWSRLGPAEDDQSRRRAR